MRSISPGMFGVDMEDLREDLSCLPLERMTGVEGVRGRDEALLGERMKGESLNNTGVPLGDGSGDDVGNGTDAFEAADAYIGGKSMCTGGLTEGENRPESFANLSEFSCGYPLRLKCMLAAAACAGEEARTGSSWSLWSSGGESSGLRWKTALFVEEGRRFGRAPSETKAPGPRSSVNEERDLRCWGLEGVEDARRSEVEGDDGESKDGAGAGAGTA